MPSIIKPTVGRIVWFWRNAEERSKLHSQPEAAIVTFVHSDRLINVTRNTHNGMTIAGTTRVKLLQEGDDIPDKGEFCEWMPYQIGQAKKYEEAVDAKGNEGSSVLQKGTKGRSLKS